VSTSLWFTTADLEALPERLVTTLREADTIESPLLPGFACRVSSLFIDPPNEAI
jgi:hypothetical protein